MSLELEMAMAASLNIGQAAQAAGVSAKMIRHYEQIGLLPEAARSDAGYRQYSERDVSVLRFIRQSRRLGFSMAQIAELLGLWSNRRRASRKVKALALQHVADLKQKMRELAEMKDALERLVASCRDSDDPHCAILDDLAAHSPSTPEPGSVGAQGLHKPSARDKKPPARATSSSHLDLMAWTHRAHAGRA
jgi:Cu(I)-responsive transcriptional regulator